LTEAAHPPTLRVARDADDDPLRLEEVVDRLALPRELGVEDDRHGRPIDVRAQPVHDRAELTEEFWW
jgi:hypothetical protein